MASKTFLDYVIIFAGLGPFLLLLFVLLMEWKKKPKKGNAKPTALSKTPDENAQLMATAFNNSKYMITANGRSLSFAIAFIVETSKRSPERFGDIMVLHFYYQQALEEHRKLVQRWDEGIASYESELKKKRLARARVIQQRRIKFRKAGSANGRY